MQPLSLGDCLKKAGRMLEQSGRSRSPALDASVLLAHCTGKDRLWCHLSREKPLQDDLRDKFFSMIKRRSSGEPVAYITGEKEFWSRKFSVNSHVLIPRPETEILVETALDFIKKSGITQPIIFEPGTGSGVIAITLAAEISTLLCIASDIDITALHTAKLNARRHGVDKRIVFVQADWLSFCQTGSEEPPFDMIVCNPPYVSQEELPVMDKNVIEFEPDIALFSHNGGIGHVLSLICSATELVKPGGMLLCEIGWQQGRVVEQHACSIANIHDVRIMQDYFGNDRLLAAHIKQERHINK